MPDDSAVIDWLVDPDHSDPAIRWQAMRDLVGSPEEEWDGVARMLLLTRMCRS